jgi:undecaprenyl-diphosphatase
VVSLFAAGGSAALWFAIAPIVHRPRPSADLVHVATSIPWGSFPSGHVLNLTATFGFFLYLSYVHIRQPVLRALSVTICSLVIGLIGVARVYSGEHWPSDVVGGYLLGVFWLLLAIRLYHAGLAVAERRRQRRRVPEATPDAAT